MGRTRRRPHPLDLSSSRSGCPLATASRTAGGRVGSPRYQRCSHQHQPALTNEISRLRCARPRRLAASPEHWLRFEHGCRKARRDSPARRPRRSVRRVHCCGEPSGQRGRDRLGAHRARRIRPPPHSGDPRPARHGARDRRSHAALRRARREPRGDRWRPGRLGARVRVAGLERCARGYDDALPGGFDQQGDNRGGGAAPGRPRRAAIRRGREQPPRLLEGAASRLGGHETRDAPAGSCPTVPASTSRASVVTRRESPLPDAFGRYFRANHRRTRPPIGVEIAPWTEWRYSGGGYMVLQKLLEDVTGGPFARVLQEMLFVSCGPCGEQWPRRLCPPNAPPPPPPGTRRARRSPAGGTCIPRSRPPGIWSTAPDLAASGSPSCARSAACAGHCSIRPPLTNSRSDRSATGDSASRSAAVSATRPTVGHDGSTVGIIRASHRTAGDRSGRRDHDERRERDVPRRRSCAPWPTSTTGPCARAS